MARRRCLHLSTRRDKNKLKTTRTNWLESSSLPPGSRGSVSWTCARFETELSSFALKQSCQFFISKSRHRAKRFSSLSKVQKDRRIFRNFWRRIFAKKRQNDFCESANRFREMCLPLGRHPHRVDGPPVRSKTSWKRRSSHHRSHPLRMPRTANNKGLQVMIWLEKDWWLYLLMRSRFSVCNSKLWGHAHQEKRPWCPIKAHTFNYGRFQIIIWHKETITLITHLDSLGILYLKEVVKQLITNIELV